MATTERCLRGTLEMMRTAAAGLKGEAVLEAIGAAYTQRLANPTYLHAQMQAYAACGDPEIREVVRKGYGEMVEYVERASGCPRTASPTSSRRGCCSTWSRRWTCSGGCRLGETPHRRLQQGRLSVFFSSPSK